MAKCRDIPTDGIVLRERAEHVCFFRLSGDQMKCMEEYHWPRHPTKNKIKQKSYRTLATEIKPY